MSIPQLPLFTNDAAGIDNLNIVVQFINQLWLYVASFVNGPGNLVIQTSSPINIGAADRVTIVRDAIGAPVIANLPLTPSVNETHTLKDGNGTAGTFNITLFSAAGIDGATTYVINFNRGAVTVVWDGTTWNAIA